MWWEYSLPHLILSTLLKDHLSLLMYYYYARLLDVEIGLHWSKNLPIVIKPEAKLLITDHLRQCEGKTIKHREQVCGGGRGGLMESRMASKFSYLLWSYFFPQISEEAGTVKYDSAHISLSQIFLIGNLYKMKKPCYEYPRVFEHSEGKLHNYVSNYLTSRYSLHLIT